MSIPVEIVNRLKEKDAVDLLGSLVRIPSENYRPDRTRGGEAEISEFLRKEFTSIGFDEVETQDTDIPGACNVIGRIKGTGGGSSLLFNGHMDTVPAANMTDPFSAKVRDGNLFGRGSSDMKGGLTSMILACKCLIDAKVKPKGDLLIAAVADEEVTHEGMSKLVKSGLKADYAVDGEGTNLDICFATKGKAEFKIETFGKAAHCSSPDLGINAIGKMAKIISALDSTMPRVLEKKRDQKFGSPAFTVANIYGGVFPVTLSTVPDYCKIELDRRLIPGETYDEAFKEIQDVIDQVRSEDLQIKTTLDLTEEVKRYPRLPYVTPTDSKIVTAISESSLQVRGRKPNLTVGQGYTDAEALRNRLGIPTVDFGPSSYEQSAHTSHEHVSIDQVFEASKILVLTAMRICGISS